MHELPWPFIGAEALAARAIPARDAGALRTGLSRCVRPVGGGPSAVERAKAAWLWSGRRGVVAGQSAAAMLGAKWIDGTQPAELIHCNQKSPSNLIVRAETLAAGEVLGVAGTPVTSASRTAFDVGRHTLSQLRALQHLDALANATDVKVADIEAIMAAHPGARGLPRLRAVL
jgi:hypothetical protein